MWPENGLKYMAPEELEHRRAYLIVSRNLVAGFWHENLQSFFGIRTKFGSKFIDNEYHWDSDGRNGTAKPFGVLDLWLPEDVEFKSNLGPFCRECGYETESLWVEDLSFYSGKKCVGNTHLDLLQKSSCYAEGTHCSEYTNNTPMMKLLRTIDDAAWEARQHPETKWRDYNYAEEK